MRDWHSQPAGSGRGDWFRRRIYREEKDTLAAIKAFVQYKPQVGKQDAEHETAISDIRYLLRVHGGEGAWLWDPYLSARDILKTLFWCPHSNVELRALTAARESRVTKITSADAVKIQQRRRATVFAEVQRKIISDATSNLRGLRLEYRMRVGSDGWAFHDRFLIFPRKDRAALAWSLGSSVNTLGKQHHILQRVEDGQLVLEAFIELWNTLDDAEHLMWKTP